MTHKKEATTRATRGKAVPVQPFDEADWVDWDHWQSIEELQNFLTGVSDSPHLRDETRSDAPDDAQQDRIARQIHRHGLEIEG